MNTPHPQDHLLTTMYNDPQYQSIITSLTHTLDLTKMEHKGADFIRDFLTFHDVPEKQATTINRFLHDFYMGTSSIGADFERYAGDAEPWIDGFQRWEYIGRLARVQSWLNNDEGDFERLREALELVAEFGFLFETDHGEFVMKRLQDMERWLDAVRNVDVKGFEDVARINVGVVGARYAVQQIWVASLVFLEQNEAARERRGERDVARDEWVIP